MSILRGFDVKSGALTMVLVLAASLGSGLAALRPQADLLSVTLVACLSALAGGGIAALYARNITRPLAALTNAIHDAAEGKFDTPLELKPGGISSSLALSFDRVRRGFADSRAQSEKHFTELLSTKRRFLAEIEVRSVVEKQLQHDAFHDPLTGLPNRALFLDRLTHVIRLSGRHQNYLYAVLFLDLDRFKVVNDSLGHLVGDQLLIAFGQRFMESVRPHDTISRLGGDEFAVLLENIGSAANAIDIAERVSAALNSSFILGKHEVFTSASIGIAMGSRAYERPEQVLRDADTAMYHAKSGDRGRFAVFEPAMHSDALARMQLEHDLRQAIERNEFTVFYQPIHSLATNCIAGFEALVRWNHPVRGLMEPGDFVPTAEETGMIVEIDRFVLLESCRQMAEWHRQGQENLEFMSVNLSGRHIVHPDLVDYVHKVLQETGLRPGALKLELTESAMLDNSDETLTTLNRLKALGVLLYIDDFGSGYSSLGYLHRLPIDGFKIDRSFISTMGDNGENQQIVRTMLLLARDMNMAVIAEGIETRVQADQIKMLDCAYGQGYLYSKPLNGSDARVLMRQSTEEFCQGN